MRYCIDEDTKKIVKAVVHGDERRKKRKRKGNLTTFDIAAAEAIRAAKEELRLEGYDKEARRLIIDKIYSSLLYNTPWENLGEMYCCRRLFYEYRRQFMYIVAMRLGMIDDGQQTTERRQVGQK